MAPGDASHPASRRDYIKRPGRPHQHPAHMHPSRLQMRWTHRPHLISRSESHGLDYVPSACSGEAALIHLTHLAALAPLRLDLPWHHLLPVQHRRRRSAHTAGIHPMRLWQSTPGPIPLRQPTRPRLQRQPQRLAYRSKRSPAGRIHRRRVLQGLLRLRLHLRMAKLCRRLGSLGGVTRLAGQRQIARPVGPPPTAGQRHARSATAPSLLRSTRSACPTSPTDIAGVRSPPVPLADTPAHSFPALASAACQNGPIPFESAPIGHRRLSRSTQVITFCTRLSREGAASQASVCGCETVGFR